MKTVVLAFAVWDGFHNQWRGVNGAGLVYHGEAKRLTGKINSGAKLHVEVRV